MNSERFYQLKLSRMLQEKTNKVFQEVSFRRKHIDIVQLHENIITCIEVKLTNWRKAIDQASINNLFCDRSFIALPHKVVKNVDLNLLEELNIGLILINGETFEIKIKPKNNLYIIGNFYEDFKTKIVRLDEN